jgi:pyridoxine 4-dehydrogenase
LSADAAGTLKLGDFTVCRIGFGALHLPRIAEKTSARALLRRVLDSGITLIDTADVYGSGASELCIAEALFPYPDHLVVATKGGLKWDAGKLVPDGRPARLRNACEESLRRLGLERIDLYQLHASDPAVPLAESIGTLADLRTEGKVRHVGVSNLSVEQLQLARSVTEVVSVQHGYNLDRLGPRGPRGLLAACEQASVPFIAWHPLADGTLSRPSERASSGIVGRVANDHGATRAQVALAWLLQSSGVTLPIPGTTSPEHLEENVGAASLRLTEEEVDSLYNHARPDR